MANNFGLFIEQKNKQIISPQMYQALEVMQLSLPELVEYINNELVENPLIEVAEDYENEQSEERHSEEEDYKTHDKYEEWLNEVVGNVLQEDRDNWKTSMAGLSQIEGVTVEGQWLDNCSLSEYLMEQLRFIQYDAKLTAQEYEIAEYIIGNLDTNGYLTLTIEEIMQAFNYIDQEIVYKALTIVQRLDPPGVGARDLKECLLLQFPLIPDCPPGLERILDYLDDLAVGHLKKIAIALKVSVAEVRAMADLLKLLDPKPGSCFERVMETKYIIPDAVIKKIEGEYFVLVNESDIPKICINERYKKALQGQDDQTIKRFLREKIGSAFNLLKSIEHRRSTIYDVLQAVVQRQREFLDEGPEALKPLTMKEIAEELGLHESTVSRVASNKYVQTPRGLCAIKCFFAGSVGGEREMSPEKIKCKLKNFISEENPKKPYSDQDLTDMFQKKGITIARRTIAKYREELRIPSSSLRKQLAKESNSR